ncbi:MAG: HPr family phosphocarrier protein [Pseudomonadota bacterium]
MSMTRQAEYEIINRRGLHARAAAKFATLAARHASDITVSRNGLRINGKSIMGLMMLAAGQGSSIGIEASGEDAQEALEALAALIARRFDEDD